MADTSAIDVSQVAGTKPGEKSAPSMEQMKSLASQFESVLLGQMMRQMRQSLFDESEEDGKGSGFSTGPLADQIYAELSLALSKAGGVGLGQALGGALARQASPSAALSGMLNDASGLVPPGMELPTGTDQVAPGTDPVAASGMLGPGGPISSRFGWRRDPIDGDVKFHKGLDIAMPIGSDVRAADGGKVESVTETPDYGLSVVVSHAGGVRTRYAHLSEATVKAGDAVAKGQVIAKSGNSGKTTGPHLHFEVINDGQPVDPAPLMR